jgi:hypothetical protein
MQESMMLGSTSLIDYTVDMKGIDVVIGWTALHETCFLAIVTLQSLFYHFVMMKYMNTTY